VILLLLANATGRGREGDWQLQAALKYYYLFGNGVF
jgi:hypothetical protein